MKRETPLAQLLCVLALASACAAANITISYNLTALETGSAELQKVGQYASLLGLVSMEVPAHTNVTLIYEVAAHNEVFWSLPVSLSNIEDDPLAVMQSIEMYPCEYEVLREEDQTMLLLTVTMMLASPSTTVLEITMSLTVDEVPDITGGEIAVQQGVTAGVIRVVADNSTKGNTTAAYAISFSLTTDQNFNGQQMLLGSSGRCPMTDPVEMWVPDRDAKKWDTSFKDAGVGTWYVYLQAVDVGNERGTCTVKRSYSPAACDTATLICEKIDSDDKGAPLWAIGVAVAVIVVVVAVITICTIIYCVHKRKNAYRGL
eukprot:TRINITY_DN7322_c0_g1_i1.p1 TRINITY_DN7322_c0_g1~~TRINITY_DN7322_c0_g1_i1.p1  ORF type:complete len:338 (+),score=80.80 TRINITY_DN7322_c0_g1_i1:68-1015(+)